MSTLREHLTVHLATSAEAAPALREQLHRQLPDDAYARVGRLPAWMDRDGKVEFILSMSARVAAKVAEWMPDGEILSELAARDRRVTVLRGLAANGRLPADAAVLVTLALADADENPVRELSARYGVSDLVDVLRAHPARAGRLLHLLPPRLLLERFDELDGSGEELLATVRAAAAATDDTNLVAGRSLADLARAAFDAARLAVQFPQATETFFTAMAALTDGHSSDADEALATRDAAVALHDREGLDVADRLDAVMRHPSLLEAWVGGVTANDPRPGEIEQACRHDVRFANVLRRHVSNRAGPHPVEAGAALQVPFDPAGNAAEPCPPVGLLQRYLHGRLGDDPKAWETTFELIDTLSEPVPAWQLADQAEFLAGQAA